ncbi:MBL fold metallo-hydrolase [Sulfurimonas lithotrophica]|uniref:histidine kinase n=2 Tax=Sulfurimonas lithotrophica TaxID=2590022 RepID=A0A5P8P468_9BACT|nr:MBL fold metallo-hydrolase [Sulfurimonas lithotrophica]
MQLKNDPFQCHPYLIKNQDESILVDPGSMLEFSETVRKVKSLVDIKDIKYIILHHQDPDLAAAVPEIEKLIDRDDLYIVTHSRMSVLIKHYLVTSKYYKIDKNDNKLVTDNGFELEFLTTPYCHSPGAFVSYEPKTKTLFSGDIFGGIEESWDFYADETYFEKAKQFHQEYMPSRDIFNYALKKIEKLDIDLIAPQHGSVVQKKYIKNLIEDMKNLDCGLYIEEKYNRELLDTIDELKEKEKTIQERDRQLFAQSKRAEIGEMIGNIAHQWRQPLAIVNTVVAIMEEKNQAGALEKDEINEKLKSITKRMEYMSDTIEDFINYYKPDKEKTMFNISKAIDKALGIVDFLTKKKDTDVKINLKVDKSLETYGLMNEYVQVIVTILSNIRDIIVEKMIDTLYIDISLYKDSGFNVLSISDNCGGISKKNLSKIFDPYFTTKHQSIGTGLGLYIAKMIIEDNMGGELSAQNKLNGAVFTIKTR